MNIFLTSECPAECARALDDRRVNNQVRETAQMLCTALRQYGLRAEWPMAVAHPHHPATKWVCETADNWQWAFEHFLALGVEKSVRYPDNPPHRSFEELRRPLWEHRGVMPAGALTPFVNCARRLDLGIDHTGEPDTVLAYRRYVVDRWRLDSVPPAWSHRGPPDWLLFQDWPLNRGIVHVAA